MDDEKRAKIIRVMRRYHDRMGLSDMPGARMFGHSWRRVDVTLHELAHAFDLGLDPRDRKLRDLNSNALETMIWPDDAKAEYRAHAVERLVLNAYAVTLPWKEQVRDAAENIDPMRTIGAREIGRCIRRQMKTKRVKALAAEVCAFIEAEART